MAECTKCRLTAILYSPQRLIGQLSTRNQLVGMLSRIPSTHPIYTGPYEAIPSFENQILGTSNKLMTSDVEVEAIYVSSVTNPAGGNTVYIGGIINHA